MLAAAGPGVSKPGLGSTGGREAQFPARGGGGLRVGIARRQAQGRPGLRLGARGPPCLTLSRGARQGACGGPAGMEALWRSLCRRRGAR